MSPLYDGRMPFLLKDATGFNYIVFNEILRAASYNLCIIGDNNNKFLQFLSFFVFIYYTKDGHGFFGIHRFPKIVGTHWLLLQLECF